MAVGIGVLGPDSGIAAHLTVDRDGATLPSRLLSADDRR